MEFTRDYFIDKFQQVSEYHFRYHCALEQCGVNIDTYEPTEESMALVMILGGKTPFDFHKVYLINDEGFPRIDWSPKQNMIKALQSINV